MPGALASGTMRKQPTTSSSATTTAAAASRKPLPQIPKPLPPTPLSQTVVANPADTFKPLPDFYANFPTPPPGVAPASDAHFKLPFSTQSPLAAQEAYFTALAATAPNMNAAKTVPARKPVGVVVPAAAAAASTHNGNPAAAAGRAAAAKLGGEKAALMTKARPAATPKKPAATNTTATYSVFPAGTMRGGGKPNHNAPLPGAMKKVTDWSCVDLGGGGATAPAATGEKKNASSAWAVAEAERRGAKQQQKKASATTKSKFTEEIKEGNGEAKGQRTKTPSLKSGTGSFRSISSALSNASKRAVRSIGAAVKRTVRRAGEAAEASAKKQGEDVAAAADKWRAKRAEAEKLDEEKRRAGVKAMIGEPMDEGAIWDTDTWRKRRTVEMGRREEVSKETGTDGEELAASGRRHASIEAKTTKTTEPAVRKLPPLVTKNLPAQTTTTTTKKVKETPVSAGGKLGRFLQLSHPSPFPRRRGTTDSDESFGCRGLLSDPLEAPYPRS